MRIWEQNREFLKSVLCLIPSLSVGVLKTFCLPDIEAVLMEGAVCAYVLKVCASACIFASTLVFRWLFRVHL